MEQELLEMLQETTGKDFSSLEAALEEYTGREIFGMWHDPGRSEAAEPLKPKRPDKGRLPGMAARH